MESVSEAFKTVVFEDGAYSAVCTDPAKPRLMEVIATFYDASRARDYADIENGQAPEEEPQIAPPAARKLAPKATPKQDIVVEPTRKLFWPRQQNYRWDRFTRFLVRSKRSSSF